MSCWIVLLVMLGLTSQATAESVQERNIVVVQPLKSKAVAAGLELVLPVLGNGYAGDARRGVLPALVSMSGFAALLTSGNDEGDAKDGQERQALVGSLLYFSGRVWGVVAAVKTVEEYNKSLLSVEPQKERIGVKVVFRF